MIFDIPSQPFRCVVIVRGVPETVFDNNAIEVQLCWPRFWLAAVRGRLYFVLSSAVIGSAAASMRRGCRPSAAQVSGCGSNVASGFFGGFGMTIYRTTVWYPLWPELQWLAKPYLERRARL